MKDGVPVRVRMVRDYLAWSKTKKMNERGRKMKGGEIDSR